MKISHEEPLQYDRSLLSVQSGEIAIDEDGEYWIGIHRGVFHLKSKQTWLDRTHESELPRKKVRILPPGTKITIEI